MADTVGTVKVGIEADSKQFEKQTEALGKKTGSGMSAIIGKSLNFAAIAAGLTLVTKGIIDSSKAMIQFEASSQQVNRIFGNSATSIQKFAEETAFGFNMSTLQATKFASIYGNLISGITSDQQENANLTQQLLQQSAVVASSTGRSMEDVMDRIRSGLLGNTEAIEDLGINVNVAMLQSTDAFKKFANGNSWDKLSFQTQQQIRLMAILEQSTSKFGTEVNQNTGSSLQKLNAIIGNISLNIGQSLKPIIDSVINSFISVATSIQTATLQFKNFMNTLFGVNEEQVKAKESASGAINAEKKLGTALGKTGKKASGALASFDEINALQEQMADSAGGASVGGVVSSETAKNTEEAKKGLSEISPLMKSIQDAIQELIPYWNFMSDSIVSASDEIMYFLKPLFSFLAENFGRGLVTIIKAASFVIGSFFKGLEVILGGWKKLIELDWVQVWNNIKLFTQQTLSGIGQFFVNAFTWIGNIIKNTMTGIWTFLTNTYTGIKESTATFLRPLGEFFSTLWNGIKTSTINIITGLKDGLSGIWNSILVTVKNVWNGIWTTIKGFLNLIIGGINAMVNAWNSLKFEMPKSSFDVFGKKVTVGGFSIGVPQIPKIPMLANGGIVSSPTLALVGEGKSSEAVLPLNQGTFDSLASAISSAMANQGQFNGNQGSQEVVINIDGTRLGRAIIPILNNENRRIGNTSVIQLA